MLSDFVFALLAVLIQASGYWSTVLATTISHADPSCHVCRSKPSGPGCQKRQYFGGCCISAALPVMLRSADCGWHTSWCTWLLHHRCHVAMTVRTLARMQGMTCDAGHLNFLQIRNSHLKTGDFGLYQSRRLLVKLACISLLDTCS